MFCTAVSNGGKIRGGGAFSHRQAGYLLQSLFTVDATLVPQNTDSTIVTKASGVERSNRCKLQYKLVIHIIVVLCAYSVHSSSSLALFVVPR